MCRSANRQAEPEVWFRVVHLAKEGLSGAPVATYREQMVEIAPGPRGAFENGTVGTLTRRAPPDQPIATITDFHDQIREFHKLWGSQLRKFVMSRNLEPVDCCAERVAPALAAIDESLRLASLPFPQLRDLI